MTGVPTSRIVLGVGAGIAAYKVATLLRLMREAGHDVTVVPTPDSLHFVGSATWEALSGNPVTTTVWEGIPSVRHVRLGQEADVVVIAPATADLLADLVAGKANNLLLATALVVRCPVVVAPAMHTEMWQHPATVANVRVLRERGVHVLEPAVGRLTGSDTGVGRLPEPEQIWLAAQAVLTSPGEPDLAGQRVLISAGGTREDIDPVRYIANRSSGRQGFALAAAAHARGAQVHLVNTADATPPAGVQVTSCRTAEQLHHQMAAEAAAADVVIMAAAVADYRPSSAARQKLKKVGGDRLQLDLVQNPDILADLVAQRHAGRGPDHQMIVGFAAETGDDSGSGLEHAVAKLARKGCDMLVFNDVSGGEVFGQPSNTVVLLRPGRPPLPVPSAPKIIVAHRILDAIAEHLR